MRTANVRRQQAELVHPEMAGPGRRLVAPVVWAVTRITLGSVFLWAFFDKTFGLGYATPAERAWIEGGSPTTGFLGGVEGPFQGFFTAMAGDARADWLFMLGLLGIGTALVLGIATRIAAAAGTLLLMLMWMAVLPLENNPLVDYHIVYALVLVGLAAAGAGGTLGLGEAWTRLPLVRRFPILR